MLAEPTDAEAKERLKTLEGGFGSEAQFGALKHRTLEIIRLRFNLHWIVPAPGVHVHGGQEPFIFLRQ